MPCPPAHFPRCLHPALLAVVISALLWSPLAAQDAPDLVQLRARADAADPEAQNALGNAYTNGLLGIAVNYAEALLWYQRAAEKGFAPALFNLGLAHDLGRGVTKDDTIAFRYYLKAAELGFPAALFNVGNMYATGRGVRQDLFESNLWYRQAADKGVPEAQFNLGLAYEVGRGLRPDLAQAAVWYQRAADKGFALAQYNLGLLLEDGRGVPKDEAAAARLYRQAAAAGLGSAQNNFGLMLHEGRGGLAQDSVEALFWLTLAVEQGVDPVARDTVAGQLSSDQVQAAQRKIADHQAFIRSPEAIVASSRPPASDPSSSGPTVATSAPPSRSPGLERQQVRPADGDRLVEQLRDQVGRLASQVLALNAEKNAIEEKLLAEREAALVRPTPRAGPDTEKLSAQLRQAEREIVRLQSEIHSVEIRAKDAEASASRTRQLAERVRELELQAIRTRNLTAASSSGATGDVSLDRLQAQVSSLQKENRELERWVQTLEVAVKNQPKVSDQGGDAAGLASRLTATEQILAATKRALEAQLAREEKLKVENSLLTVRFQQAEDLLAVQNRGGKLAEVVELKRELQDAQAQVEALKREKDGLTNVWVDEQRSLKDAKARIASLEQELAKAWRAVEIGPKSLPSAFEPGQNQEIARLRREQENAAALLAISRHALDATEDRTAEMNAEIERLRLELGRVQGSRSASVAGNPSRNPEQERLIASLQAENEKLNGRLTRMQKAIDQIVSVVRNGAVGSDAAQ